MERPGRRQKRFRTEKWLEGESPSPDTAQQRTKKPKTTIPSGCLVIKCAEIASFFKIFEDSTVQDFLVHDICQRISDKYLIAMTFAYFKRAHLSLDEYTAYNFFLALYLANDMEEDEENFRYEMFPWILGKKWRDKFPKFLRDRDLLWSRMNYRAAIIEVQPTHYVWKRERSEYHGGALRTHLKSSAEREPFPKGPGRSPIPCKHCYPMSVSSGKNYFTACHTARFKCTYASATESDISESSMPGYNDYTDESECDTIESPIESEAIELKKERGSESEERKVDDLSDDSFSMEELWWSLS